MKLFVLISYPMPKYENVTKIETVSLDEILKNEARGDAIRMDIEGGEYEVISGMMETIRLHHPFLLIELHPSPKRKLFLRELHTLGYECLILSKEGETPLYSMALWQILVIY